jgi:hypothetical protein
MMLPRFRRYLPKRVAVIGLTDHGAELIRHLQTSKKFRRTTIVGFFDDRDMNRLPPLEVPVPKLGPTTEIHRVVQDLKIDALFLALSVYHHPRSYQWINILRATAVHIFYVPDYLMFDFLMARKETIFGVPVLSMDGSEMFPPLPPESLSPTPDRNPKSKPGKPRIMVPPGERLARILRFLLTSHSYALHIAIFISEMQAEWLEAISSGQGQKAKWIAIRGHLLIIWPFLRQLLLRALRLLFPWW